MQRDSYAPGAERRAEMAEAAGDGGAAMLTVARIVEGVGEDLVPVAFDHRSPAAGAVGRPAAAVVDIAGVDVAQARVAIRRARWSVAFGVAGTPCSL